MYTADDTLRAIREKCLECSGGIRRLADGCLMRDCPLWPFRSDAAMRADDHRDLRRARPQHGDKMQMTLFSEG